MEKFSTQLFLFCLITGLPVMAQSKRKRNDTTTVTIQFTHSYNRDASVDSALVILDKHNRTGAGTIKQLYYPVNNRIVIPNVPEGKYYIDVVCLGIHQESFREVSYVYEKRSNKNLFRINLKSAEKFDRSTVYIPPETIDAARLKVLKTQFRQ